MGVVGGASQVDGGRVGEAEGEERKGKIGLTRRAVTRKEAYGGQILRGRACRGRSWKCGRCGAV